MSAFDIKPISEQDAFKLQEAKREEAQGMRSDEPAATPTAFDPENSPVSQVVEQIMSHWADTDEQWVQELAEQTGDERLKKVVGEAALKDTKPSEGMEGDFQADTAGPTEMLDLPPKADGGEFGGGGGGGGGDGGDLGLPAWMGDEGGMADPGDMPEAPAELPGFSMEAEETQTYGGDDGGDAEDEDEEPQAPPPPEDPKKPKKP